MNARKNHHPATWVLHAWWMILYFSMSGIAMASITIANCDRFCAIQNEWSNPLFNPIGSTNDSLLLNISSLCQSSLVRVNQTQCEQSEWCVWDAHGYCRPLYSPCDLRGTQSLCQQESSLSSSTFSCGWLEACSLEEAQTREEANVIAHSTTPVYSVARFGLLLTLEMNFTSNQEIQLTRERAYDLEIKSSIANFLSNVGMIHELKAPDSDLMNNTSGFQRLRETAMHTFEPIEALIDSNTNFLIQTFIPACSDEVRASQKESCVVVGASYLFRALFESGGVFSFLSSLPPLQSVSLWDWNVETKERAITLSWTFPDSLQASQLSSLPLTIIIRSSCDGKKFQTRPIDIPYSALRGKSFILSDCYDLNRTSSSQLCIRPSSQYEIEVHMCQKCTSSALYSTHLLTVETLPPASIPPPSNISIEQIGVDVSQVQFSRPMARSGCLGVGVESANETIIQNSTIFVALNCGNHLLTQLLPIYFSADGLHHVFFRHAPLVDKNCSMRLSFDNATWSSPAALLPLSSQPLLIVPCIAQDSQTKCPDCAIPTSILASLLFLTLLLFLYFYLMHRRQSQERRKSSKVSYNNRDNISLQSLTAQIATSEIEQLTEQHISDFLTHPRLPRIISLEYLRTFELLGSGNFGDVKKGVLAEPDQTSYLIAVKSLFVQSEKIRQQILHEAAIMAQLTHPNIVKLVGLSPQQDEIKLLLEYCEHGTLRECLQVVGEEIPIGVKIHMSSEIACAVDFISSLGLVHRDLATRNVLLGTDLTCKLSDFGLAKFVKRGADSITIVKEEHVPLRWTAPESLRSQVYSFKTDVWSFGVLMWEIFSNGTVPYEGVRNVQVVEGIKNNTLKLSKPHDCDGNTFDIISACLNWEADKRPKFEEIAIRLNSISTGSEARDSVMHSLMEPRESAFSKRRRMRGSMDSEFSSSSSTRNYSDASSLGPPLRLVAMRSSPLGRVSSTRPKRESYDEVHREQTTELSVHKAETDTKYVSLLDTTKHGSMESNLTSITPQISTEDTGDHYNELSTKPMDLHSEEPVSPVSPTSPDEPNSDGRHSRSNSLNLDRLRSAISCKSSSVMHLMVTKKRERATSSPVPPKPSLIYAAPSNMSSIRESQPDLPLFLRTDMDLLSSGSANLRHSEPSCFTVTIEPCLEPDDLPFSFTQSSPPLGALKLQTFQDLMDEESHVF